MSQKPTNKTTWRSLQDLADTPEFRAYAAQEFPGFSNIYEGIGEAQLAGETTLNRRKFLALSAAGLGLAGLAGTGCRRPDFEILPYTKTPDDVKYSLPTYYATSVPRASGSFPILVESHTGRPTKIEGNPSHPLSGGSSDTLAQASVLDLYSPDRSVEVLKNVAGTSWAPTTWGDFEAFAEGHFAAYRGDKKGEGLAILTDGVPSPAFELAWAKFTEAMPKAKLYRDEPINSSNAVAGTKLAFGEALQVCPQFDQADRILSLDCDFLGLEPNEVGNTKAYFAKRRPEKIDAANRKLVAAVNPDFKMNRLYVVEPTFTITGTMADHRLRLPSSHVADYIVALATKLGVKPELTAELSKKTVGVKIPSEWIDEVAKDLSAKDVKSLVVVGQRQPALVHALAAAINESLNGAVKYRAIPESKAGTLADLVAALKANSVKTLVIFGGNPIYTAPADYTLADLLAKVPTVIHSSLFVDETAEQLVAKKPEKGDRWHLPLTHYLETWGDTEAFDGSYLAIQPLIAPLHGGASEPVNTANVPTATSSPRGGRSVLELLVQFSAYKDASSSVQAAREAYNLVKESFLAKWKATNPKETDSNAQDNAWKQFLHLGHLPGTARPFVTKPVAIAAVAKAVADYTPAKPVSASNRELSLHVDYRMYDGRNLHNTWLLELPDPVTKLSWDNAAILSPATAKELGFGAADGEHVRSSGVGEVIELRLGNAEGAYTLKLPVFILPGQADNVISVHLGWGKLRVTGISEGGGYNAYPFRTSANPYFATGLEATKTGETVAVACTQEHGVIPEQRVLFEQFGTLSEYKHALEHHEHHANETAKHGKDDHKDHDHKHDDHGHDHSHDHDHAHEGDHGHAHGHDPKKNMQAGYDESVHKGDKKEYRRLSLDLSYPELLDSHHQWGMVIDLNACTGCSACMIACQSENNIPIVGKPEIIRNREMHWIRLDRYFTTDVGESADEPHIVNQPMACVHCEMAPCEAVCPVNAAVHSPEGLNLQVYNRCIGTRYCANNCPYKVRRFNWFNFNLRPINELRLGVLASKKEMADTLQMQKNPDVTVRGRGVMEKCTYCVQRIERGKIGAKLKATAAIGTDGRYSKPADPKKAGYALVEKNGRTGVIVPDGVITPACAQACPSEAIVFGNVADTSSLVYQLKQLNTDYLTLGELNVKPRTSYRPRLRNYNPAMLPKKSETKEATA